MILTIALCTLMYWLLYKIFERVVLAVLVVMMLLLASGCTNTVPMPKPWECHKAIRYYIYPRHACVTMEADMRVLLKLTL